MGYNKLRILCLHGFSQNATILYKKTGFLRESLKSCADFEYLSGPITLQSAPLAKKTVVVETSIEKLGVTKEFEPLKAWFRIVGNEYVGFESTLKRIREYILDEGPFDGILGFSQGAVVASVLSVMIERHHYLVNPDGDLPCFKFSVLISGFVSHADGFSHLYETPIETPSIHVFGNEDDVVNPNLSEHLSSCYTNPAILRHDFGHTIPFQPIHKTQLVDFIKKFARNQPVYFSSKL